jgi:hypothetical protein
MKSPAKHAPQAVLEHDVCERVDEHALAASETDHLLHLKEASLF